MAATQGNRAFYYFLVDLPSMNFIFAGISLITLFAIELMYFKIADRFNIVDKPNSRSSHSVPIIRGGGILFFFGVLIWFWSRDFQWPWFMLSVLIIAVISFLDDVTSLNAAVRFVFQLVAVLLVFYQLAPVEWPVYLLVVAVIVCVGTLNAFNFMDGINGITGIYALVAIASFAVIHFWVVPFTDVSLLMMVGISIFVFLFFNFRKRARCFGGDVGSVTLALILIFLLLQLIQGTHNFFWPLLFLVYGTDSIITILYRLKRRENIFEAHRTHLFQYFSNELKVPHLLVSAGYGLMQMILNLIFIYSFERNDFVVPLVVSSLFVVAYLIVRTKVTSYIFRMT
jgi:UDP-N-acetylmuramyl pentapeptide phosphotransferase/UDP-N-acetylglucosamine-1-phosphate transferase